MRQIQWTRDGVELNLKSDQYIFGSSEDIFLKITSPTEKDIGKYVCTVTDDIGSTQQDVTLGIIKTFYAVSQSERMFLLIFQIIKLSTSTMLIC